MLRQPSIRYSLSRRRFVTGLAAGALASPGAGAAATGREPLEPRVLSGSKFDLDIGYREVNFTGKDRLATVINGSLPAPVLRWREGDDIALRVTNRLAADSSIHWHGLILPPEMDGVPGLSFDGIRPGEAFTYRFPAIQSGTYWYHSHSGFQEQTGMYGAIIIDPREPEPFSYDREHVIILSDWSDEKPERIFARLRKEGHYYNLDPRTLGDLARELGDGGLRATLADRGMWNRMRMSDRDIADVTAMTYTYLLNGATPDSNWTGLFKPGEKVRLRLVNAGAMTLFDVRIPGLKMTVVAADGQNIEPVTVDELRMGSAETYDVIVEPQSGAYTIFAQSIDRGGYARGTLAEADGLSAEVPALDQPPVLTHADMGMAHGAHSGHGGMNHSGMGHDGMNHEDMNHADPNHSAHSSPTGIAPAGMGSWAPVSKTQPELSYRVDMRAEMPLQRLDDPGIGLRNNGRRVLTYADLYKLGETADRRDPEREIQLHLTGNMERYLWSFDGVPFADAKPLRLGLHERVRITLVNDTMMNHPIHLHGMWSELETGDGARLPLKHTVIVQPGSKLSYLVTPDVAGQWAYHCHLAFHMAGMFRVVDVT